MANVKKKILVTGGAGFIGTHLSRRLMELGHSVVVLDLKSPETAVAGVEYLLGDVRDAQTVQALVARVEVVYHLAAIVSVPLCQGEPVDSYSTNFNGTLVVLDALRKQAAATHTPPLGMIFASTAAVYGNVGLENQAVREEQIASHFSSFYAAQKSASEQALDQYRKAFGIPSLAFRFFNVFGPGQDPASPYSGVITIFARLAREGKPLLLNGGGAQTRDFISVLDIVDGLAAALQIPTSRWNAQAINLGSGTTITIRALAELIRELIGQKVRWEAAPPREGDVLHSLADISRATELIGFNPKRSLKKCLGDLLNRV